MKTITTLTLLLLSALGARAWCVAPCTYTDNFWWPCVITTTFAAPVNVPHPDEQFKKLCGSCHESINPCPEPPPAPEKKSSFANETLKCTKYSISGGASWEVFNLSASASTEESTKDTTAGECKVTAWCQRVDYDMFKSHYQTDVSWTQTINSTFWCWPNGNSSGTMVLHRYEIGGPRSPADPPVCSVPANCKTSCP